MNAAAKPSAENQAGKPEFTGVFAGGGGLNAANFGNLVQGDWTPTLQDPQDLQPAMIGQPLKDPLLTTFGFWRGRHLIRQFAKILIFYKRKCNPMRNSFR